MARLQGTLFEACDGTPSSQRGGKVFAADSANGWGFRESRKSPWRERHGNIKRRQVNGKMAGSNSLSQKPISKLQQKDETNEEIGWGCDKGQASIISLPTRPRFINSLFRSSHKASFPAAAPRYQRSFPKGCRTRGAGKRPPILHKITTLRVQTFDSTWQRTEL
jgi:hypothetical protein